MLTKQQPTASRRALKYAGLFLLLVSLSWISLSSDAILGSVFARIAPTAEVERTAVDRRPDTSNNAPFRTWGEDLSAQAVDAGGIEKDLDGNASALIASPRE